MSATFWTGAVLFTVAGCGLIFMIWYGILGGSRRNRGPRR